MPDIDQFTQVTQYLEQYGGWAVAVIMMVVILYLHRTTSNLLEKRNNELKSLLVECKSVIAENRVFLDRVEDAVESTESVVEKNTDVLHRVKLYLEDIRR
jgi:hypothetical protein